MQRKRSSSIPKSSKHILRFSKTWTIASVGLLSGSAARNYHDGAKSNLQEYRNDYPNIHSRLREECFAGQTVIVKK
jgi:hypothetical protein